MTSITLEQVYKDVYQSGNVTDHKIIEAFGDGPCPTPEPWPNPH